MTGPRRMDRDALAEAIKVCAVTAPHAVPILEAARCGAICLLSLTRDHPAALGLLPTDRPALVLVPDDDDARTGPSGWPSVGRLIRWSAAAFIHAAAGTVGSYRSAVIAATACQRLVLVECGSAHVMAWHSLFDQAGRPTVNFIPPEGHVHPVQEPEPGVLH